MLSDIFLLQWPVNWSLASYEDVGEFFQKSLFKDTAAPGTQLTDVMSSALTVAYPEMSLEAAKKLFKEVTLHTASMLLTILGTQSGRIILQFGQACRACACHWRRFIPEAQPKVLSGRPSPRMDGYKLQSCSKDPKIPNLLGTFFPVLAVLTSEVGHLIL
jgi:hypothetical protein